MSNKESRLETKIIKENAFVFNPQEFIGNELLQRLYSYDAYKTKEACAFISGVELESYKHNKQKLKALLIKRLDESYQQIRKEIKEA